MTAHKLLIAMTLVCGTLAPFESQAQSVCMTLAESDSVGSEVLARVKDYVSSNEPPHVAARNAYGYPALAASQVTLVTQNAVCTKAEAAYRAATTGGAGRTGRVVVIKAGNTLTVLDPGWTPSVSSPSRVLVLMDNKYKLKLRIQG
jgi:hypothetical protein